MSRGKKIIQQNISTYTKGDVIELPVEKLVYGGKGLASTPQGVVFIEGGLPASRVKARITKVKKRFSEAGVVEVTLPSPFFVDSECPYFGECGGCSHLNLEYEEQLFWKREQVLETMNKFLAAAGYAQEELPVVHPALPSPKRDGYRNKMEFSFSGSGPDLKLGLRRKKSHDIISIKSCRQATEQTTTVMQRMRELCAETGLPAYNPKSGKGFFRYLVVRDPLNSSDFQVRLITSHMPQAETAVSGILEQMYEEFPQLTSAAHTTAGAERTTAYGDAARLCLGSDAIDDSVCGMEFRISGQSFFQTNTAAAALLFDQVREYLGGGGNLLWDVFCGVGVVSCVCGDLFEEVVGFETADSAVQDAEDAARRNIPLVWAEFKTGDAGKLMQREQSRPDAVVVDPPRSGLREDMVAELVARSPQTIVYVSCDPPALARDAGRMADAYRMVEVTPVDMFPHTPNIEAVALLRKR